MPFSAPIKIIIYSDGSELEFTGAKAGVYYYKYVKASPKAGKLNTILPITEEHLIRLIKTQEVLKPKHYD